MSTYCTRCHSSTLTGAARNGATSYHDFDTLKGVKDVMDHIDQTAGAGPDATNESMPPNGTKPSLAERQQLAEWIACQAP
jgi:cytochrome c5